MADLPCCVLHGTTKHAQHASAPDCRPALQFLAQRLHLFSFILSDDSLMLGHFLRHYHRLGVWPAHTRIAVRARRHHGGAHALNATLRVLRRARVPEANVRILHTAPSDTLKIRLMNEQIDSLPIDSWFVYADVDELFDYPCELQGAVLRNKVCFAGAMLDQLAADGRIGEMMPNAPPLAVQYPLQCRIRSTIVPHLQTSKVILHRVGVRNATQRMHFRTTHMLSGGDNSVDAWRASRCAVRGIVRHYTMTTRQLVENRRKATAYGTRTANYANATCGHIEPKTGRCLDYALLQRFMEERLGSASKSGGGTKAAPAVWPCPHTLQKMAVGAPCSSTNRDMC